ncbi:MAG: hypothetical protein AAGA35_04325 [Patescibacteria group bacterium]
MPLRKRKRRAVDPQKLFIVRQFVIGLVIIIVLGLIGTGVWYGSRVESLTIKNIEVIGGTTINHEEVRGLASEQLLGDYFRLVPRTFAWTYPRKDIQAAVEGVERVKAVEVERVSGTDIVVAFEEFVPFALWCAEKGSDNCYFIERTGYTFAPAPSLSGGGFVRYLTIGVAPAVGKIGLTREQLAETELFRAILESELGFFVTHIEIDSEDDVYYTLAGGGELKAGLNNSSEEVIENLITILQSEAFSHLKPGNFQYIDLRFGNKVYVNEEPEQVETASTSEAVELRFQPEA